MFGGKLLVSPKRGDPESPVLQMTIEHSIRQVTADSQLTAATDVGGLLVEVYLPADALWYSYYSKQV